MSKGAGRRGWQKVQATALCARPAALDTEAKGVRTGCSYQLTREEELVTVKEMIERTVTQLSFTKHLQCTKPGVTSED